MSFAVSTTVEITIGYLTVGMNRCILISTTVEITIGYLTVLTMCHILHLQQ